MRAQNPKPSRAEPPKKACELRALSSEPSSFPSYFNLPSQCDQIDAFGVIWRFLKALDAQKIAFDAVRQIKNFDAFLMQNTKV